MRLPELLTPSMATASRHVATRSVLNPILWLSGIVWPAALAAMAFAPAPFNYFAAAVGGLTVLMALSAYAYFALKDPDRLQTEEFRLQQQMVARLGDNRSHEEIALSVGEQSRLTANTVIEGAISGE